MRDARPRTVRLVHRGGTARQARACAHDVEQDRNALHVGWAPDLRADEYAVRGGVPADDESRIEIRCHEAVVLRMPAPWFTSGFPRRSFRRTLDGCLLAHPAQRVDRLVDG